MRKKRELHQSEVATYMRCGKKWEFRYIQKIETPTRPELTTGSSFHTAIQYNFRHKIQTGKYASKTQVLDAFSTDFDKRRTDTEWRGSDPGKEKDMGARLVELHRTQLAPTIEPEKVEEHFSLQTDAPFDIGGTIDLITKSGVIVDHKTSKKAYSGDAVSNSFQAAVYDFGYEHTQQKKAAGFRFDVVIKGNPPSVQQVPGKVTPEHREFMLDAIIQVDRAMRAGIAMPAPELPGVWWCAEKYCEFWKICKGKGRPSTLPPRPTRKLDGIFPTRSRKRT